MLLSAPIERFSVSHMRYLKIAILKRCKTHSKKPFLNSRYILHKQGPTRHRPMAHPIVFNWANIPWNKCRAAPATPGLLILQLENIQKVVEILLNSDFKSLVVQIWDCPWSHLKWAQSPIISQEPFPKFLYITLLRMSQRHTDKILNKRVSNLSRNTFFL